MVIWLVLGTLLPSFLISWSAGFLIRREAPRWGLIDRPGHRKVHTSPTPLGGGIAVWLGVIVTFALGQGVLWLLLMAGHGEGPHATDSLLPSFVAVHLPGISAMSGSLWMILLLASGTLLLGLIDDLRGLDWRWRLGAEFGLALGLVVWKGWRLTFFVDNPWITGAATVIWIVWLINSFNMLDNMDGLSGGVAGIAALLLATTLLLVPESGGAGPQLFVGGFLLVLVGSLAGFLWHNRPPARLFMGDAGSYFIGFYLAVATILATFVGRDVPRHAILAPVCILAVPLYDTVSVLWIRLREGRSLFTGDKSHFSHRLVDLGMSKSQAVGTIYLATATCGLGALLLRQVNGWGALVIGLMVACVLALVAMLERAARQQIQK